MMRVIGRTTTKQIFQIVEMIMLIIMIRVMIITSVMILIITISKTKFK